VAEGLLVVGSGVIVSAGGRSAPVRAISISHHGIQMTIWNTRAASERARESSGRTPASDMMAMKMPS
jgi:hypothetical protein